MLAFLSAVSMDSSCERERLCVVGLRWQLSFEFTVEAGHSSELLGSSETIRNAPSRVEVDTLRWMLPISVLPTNPVHLPASIVNHVVTIE
jgi:hypothetical protein